MLSGSLASIAGDLVILFRPVGIEELVLVYQSGMKAFPPRLPDQPIFYPVLNEEYAIQIAQEWNTRFGSRAGYVTRFEVSEAIASKYEVQTVGARQHQELWVPAESLKEFNESILGQIVVTRAYFGDGFRGLIPSEGPLKGCDAVTQLATLQLWRLEERDTFVQAIRFHREITFVHLPFWETVPNAAATTRECLAVLADQPTIKG